MNTRIKQVRLALGLTQKEFGTKLGYSSSISELENGTARIVDRTIVAICSVFNVNEHWLRTGEGQMFVFNQNLDEFMATFSKLNKPLQDFLIKCAKNLLETQELL